MTFEEAKIMLEKHQAWARSESRRYSEAVDIAIECIEKQIPKKPVEERYFGEMGSKIGFCPNCHTGQSCDDNSIQHCYYCSQAIDWSDEK